MSHPFGNDTFRFGSARCASEADIARAGMFTQTPGSIFIGFFNGRPLWYAGPGGVSMVAGARSGKLRDVLAYNICNGILAGETLLILDVKGELAAISQDQRADKKYCIFWNPAGLRGAPAQHRINPLGHLAWTSPTLFSDIKVVLEGLLPNSGAGNARYFELNARRIAEALCLTLAKTNGVVTFPDLYDAILRLQEGGDRWIDFAYEMYASGIDSVRSVEAEIYTARSDSSGGYRGVLGELQQALACLSDPVLRAALSPPFDATMDDLCRSDRTHQFYIMVPPEMLETWAPVVKTIFASAMTLKGRNPGAPRQTFVIDEAGRLDGYAHIPRLFTDGAGMGIRPFAIFQDFAQMNKLAPDGDNFISSSAGCQIYFGLRNPVAAKRVSELIGIETLTYDERVSQGRSEIGFLRTLRQVFTGQDPFEAVYELDQSQQEKAAQEKQERALRTPDELVYMPANRMVVVADGLPGAIYAERRPYWEQPWMAGRFMPNPYHPPQDKVLVQTPRGPAFRPIRAQPVEPAFIDYPQYQSGWMHVVGEEDVS